MKIRTLEQSGLILEARNGFKLAIDIGAYTPVEELAGVKADAVLVSHLHPDHLSAPQIKALEPVLTFLSQECMEALGGELIPGEVVRIKAGEKFEAGPFSILPFDADHGPNVSVKPKENFGFLIECDGEKIWFGGDMFYPSGLDVQNLDVDYAFIPVGGFYTFDAEAAALFARAFKKAGTFVPMHWRPGPENKDKFLALAKEKGLYAATL